MRLGLEFFFGPMFPAAVKPPILRWVLPNQIFNGLGVFGCNPQKRVILIFPFIGHDYAIGLDFEEEAVADSSAAADDDGEVIGQGQKSYALVGTGFTAKEVHENSFSAGVLIGDKTESAAFCDDLLHKV